MRRKIPSIAICIVLILSSFVMLNFYFRIIDVAGGEVLNVNITGSNGAYIRIQDAINASSDGDTVFVYGGTYYENVVVNKTISLIGDDKNTTIIDGGGNGDGVLITSDYVNVSGFKVTNCGPWGSPDYDSGIEVCSDYNNVIGNIIKNNYFGITTYQTSNNYIKDNDITSNDESGIILKSSSFNHIIQNNVSSNDWCGITLYSSSNNNQIKNNIVFDNRWGIQVTWDANNNTIAYNNVSYNNDAGIYLYRTYGNQITNNNVSNNVYLGVHIFDTYTSIISGNHFIRNGIFMEGEVLSHYNSHDILGDNTVNGKLIYYYKDLNGIMIDGLPVGQIIIANCADINIRNLNINNTDVGIIAAFSTNITVTNCIISSNNRDGIHMHEVINCTLFDNVAIQNRYFGIYLSSSSYNKVTDNNASNNSGGIVLVFSSNKNTIMNNKMHSNGNFGVYIGGISDDNNVSYNNASHGNRYGYWLSVAAKNNLYRNSAFDNDNGIYVTNSFRNNITQNNLVNNNRGIYIHSSTFHWIYYNNFINNTIQAQDESSNYWDSGYPLGGNYWSNYVGEDLYKGPNQDKPGSDGIGDINYSIDSDSIDKYPLMEAYTYKPLENYTILKQGWNLISIPLIQQNQNLQKVLEMIDGYYDAVQWHKPNDLDDPWKHFKVGKPFGNDLFELNETMGFWIYITNPGDTIFLYNGTQPTENQSIYLTKGWNMVGYPSQTTYNRTIGLNNLNFGVDVEAVQWYDSTTKSWHFMEPDDTFVPGKGYWVHSNVDALWEVPL